MPETHELLDRWFEQVADLASMQVTEIPLAESGQWSFTEGAIRHSSDRFFAVVGTNWTSPRGEQVSQPLLLQSGTGIIGFLLDDEAGVNRLLAYAKVEPGNVNDVQLAPTCQATESNIDRVHGGSTPPFAELFLRRKTGYPYHTLQSEQGTRFMAKQNRNVIAVGGGPEEPPITHRWLPVEELLDLSDVSFVLNSDTRSLLTCGPWERLVGRRPFGRQSSGFGAELARSAEADPHGPRLETLLIEVEQQRRKAEKPVVVDLDELSGWRLTDSGVKPSSGRPFRVQQIRVEVKGREVSCWDQPIIDSAGVGRVDLLCGRFGGVVHFLLRPFAEPGLHNMVEIGPTLQVEPGGDPDVDLAEAREALVRAECHHSEEGSRFYRDVNLFRIVDVGDAFEPPQGMNWLTLANIRTLLDGNGWLTSEGRSALSLLLKWL